MILHLDMDAFFASIEQMDHPMLRGKPVVVGGGIRGVVATASYEARAFGIHSAMAMSTAHRLCPAAICIKPRGWRYSEISHNILEALQRVSPIVEQASIDEAYLDLSGLVHLYGTYENLARAVATAVSEASGGLSCSIGIAPVKFLAKIASEVNKPGGIFILKPDDVENFLAEMPIRKLPGVGKRLAANLLEMGIKLVGQLRELSREFLVSRFGKCGEMLYNRSQGRDSRKVQPILAPKSESAEGTFLTDVQDENLLAEAVLKYSEKVSRRLRAHNIAGRTVSLKIKYADFTQITRSRTLGIQTNATSIIYSTARALLYAEKLLMPVRLIGVGVSGFNSQSITLPLPGLFSCDSVMLDQTLDAICSRYGADAIRRATSLNPRES